jgi:hypothetical protein
VTNPIRDIDQASAPRWVLQKAELMSVVGRLVLAFLVFAVCSDRAKAGSCLTRPPAFQLANDEVNWTFSLEAGSVCIQGLRYAAMLIDQVSLVGAPKGGRVAIAGPSFQYFASPEFHGTDSFTLQVTGSKVLVTGTSLIQVDVTVP